MVAWARSPRDGLDVPYRRAVDPGFQRDRRRRGARGEPDIAGHINGGTTSLSEADIERLVDGDSDIALELVHCGNGRTAL